MDYLTLLQTSSLYGVRRDDDILEPNATLLDALSVEYLFLPNGFHYPNHEQIVAPDDSQAAVLETWRNRKSLFRSSPNWSK